MEIDHISGDESDGEPENLMWLCRSCNTRKGVQQARNRIGRRTRQYNPERISFKRYKAAIAVLLGLTPGDVGAATSVIRETEPQQREAFTEKLAEHNPAGVPTFAQYARGVAIHKRGARDEGGAIIHATPPALRSRYARQIARIKRQRGEVPF